MLLAAGMRRGMASSRSTRPQQPVRAALERLLQALRPIPGWCSPARNVVRRTSQPPLLPPCPTVTTPVLNIFRASLHPGGLAAHTANFADWGRYLLGALQRSIDTTGDPGLRALQQEVLAYPNVIALSAQVAEGGLANSETLPVPCVLDLPFGRVSLFSTLTTFGTPRDITLDELCVELFYPADDESARLLRAAA